MSILLQSVPLPVEEELNKRIEEDVVAQHVGVSLNCIRTMHAEILVIPLHPAFHSEISFKSHELGVRSDPSILSQKRVKIPAVFLPAPFSSDPEHRESPVKDRPVINMLRILSPTAGKDLLPGEKSVLHQKIKIY